MNPFKTLALAIVAHMTEFRARINKQVKDLPPLEQVEACELAKNVLRTSLWAAEDANRLADTYDLSVEKLEKMFQETVKAAGEEVMTAALASGDVIRKDDHVNLIAEAKTAGKTEAQTEFAAEQKKVATITERRGVLAGKVGEIAAAAATDEQLLADNWETLEVTAKERITRLTEIHITAEGRPESFKSLASIPLTAEGLKEFDSRLPAYAELAKSAPVPKPGEKKPETPAIITGNDDGKGKKSKHLI